MSILEAIHGGYVFQRRVRVLSQHLADLLLPQSQVLDVGCGDGQIAKLIQDRRPDVSIKGIDVLLRPQTLIPVQPFDGQTIPFGDQSFDVVMFVDVLHHTTDPLILLREAARVARQAVVIKDHNRNGWLPGPTLRFMDWVGNARHGVSLPYNYWTEQQWLAAFRELNLKIVENRKQIGLYSWFANWLFGRSLHFVIRLERNDKRA